jgi:hypothetical protein
MEVLKRFPLRNISILLLLIGLLPSSTLVCDAQSPADDDRIVAGRAISELSVIDNKAVRIGIDPNKGGSIAWLSSRKHPANIVNHSDAGRLIQQSYYAGKILNRKDAGQHHGWSPWAWNPIQGGSIGCWATARRCERQGDVLYSETTPKLWDMDDEDAQAIMRQWISFEKDIENAVVIKCQLQSLRKDDDLWGSKQERPQEVPACYFVRSFSQIESYAGKGQWKRLRIPPGPPWSKVEPKHNAMAMFNVAGNGVALFSPTATEHWNVGPHANKNEDMPTSKPCVHVAPISRLRLPERSTYEYRYWLIVGTRVSIEASLDKLIRKYSDERAKLTP